MKVNINQKVKVILTDTGKDILLEKAPIIYYHECNGDYLELELWKLMQVFGNEIYLGISETPFIDNQI
ncbi:MAG: hypothetical protein FH762_10150 [Firmicutes bacterium]|nr:hypothetical protein [Bacillota bacterium]